MPRQVPVPPHAFQAGIDPTLREWLSVRRLAREAKAKRRPDEDVATYATAIKYRYHSWWVDRVMNREEEVQKPFHLFQEMLRATAAVGREAVALAMLHSKGLKFMEHAHSEGFNLNFSFPLTEKSLLHLAVDLGDKEKVIFLLAHGASVHARDKRGFTPLHLSVKPHASPFHSDELTLLLLEHGADIGAQDADGRTSLHLACLLRSQEFTELLLAWHADINVIDRHGQLPYDCAAGQVSFRRWFDGRCFKLAPAQAYGQVRAKLLARAFVKEVFQLTQPKCDTCKRKLGACHELKKSNFRYWAYCHDLFKGEKAT